MLKFGLCGIIITMTESNQHDYPADGSDSVLPTPGTLKDTPQEVLDKNTDKLREIREQVFGSSAVSETVETVQPDRPSESTVFTPNGKRSLGNLSGH